MCDYGPQYSKDDQFKAKARLHQSRYRAEVLKVGYCEYGNRLKNDDAKQLLNYFDGLGVRGQLRLRFPNFSFRRDGDLLRSEHIPFNFFGPLASDFSLAKQILGSAFTIECNSVMKVKFEYKPSTKQEFLNDNTAFDTYIEIEEKSGIIAGIGIEVKFTEGSYSVSNKTKEYKNVHSEHSRYWQVTRNSGCFIEGPNEELISNRLRQIWRNHLLGLSMVGKGIIDNFYLVIVYPKGNTISNIIPAYKKFLVNTADGSVIGCTYEHFINSIEGNREIQKWKEYLYRRYLV